MATDPQEMVFELTDKGKTALAGWLGYPVEELNQRFTFAFRYQPPGPDDTLSENDRIISAVVDWCARGKGGRPHITREHVLQILDDETRYRTFRNRVVYPSTPDANAQ